MHKRTGTDSKRSSADILLSYLSDPQCMDGQQPIGQFTRQFRPSSRLEFRLGVPCRSSIPFEFPWPQRRPSSFGHASFHYHFWMVCWIFVFPGGLDKRVPVRRS